MKIFRLADLDGKQKRKFVYKLLSSIGKGTVYDGGRLVGMYNEFMDEASPHGTCYIQTAFTDANKKTGEYGKPVNMVISL